MLPLEAKVLPSLKGRGTCPEKIGRYVIQIRRFVVGGYDACHW